MPAIDNVHRTAEQLEVEPLRSHERMLFKERDDYLHQI